MKTTLCLPFALALASFLQATLAAEPLSPYANETAAQRDARMQWWREARFGMFIHWGLYAIPAGEWQGTTNHAEWIRHTAQIPRAQYDQLVPQFNPVRFDAAEWARLARRAGMKYLVLTSKHHDGFCLWDSTLTDFDVASTPFRRDILQELSTACKREGVRFSTYHSIMDWHHPDYLPRRTWEKETWPAAGADFARYRTYLHGQLRELVERYRPGVLWFDGEWEDTWTHELGVELYDHVRRLDPKIIINNRVDKGRKGMQGLTKEGQFRGDFGTPEQEIPAQGLPGMDWESCMTMNRHWGWNRFDTDWKSTKTLIRDLVDIASKGGNYLLNIGPRADGTFPPEAIERLEGIGRWMDQHSDAIYGTTASPFRRLPWGRCTQKASGKDTTLFLHVFNWPVDGRLFVPGLQNPVKSARLLTGGKLQAIRTPEGVTLLVPASAPDTISSTVVLKIKGTPEVLATPISQESDGAIRLMASEAELQGALQYESGRAKDNIGYWTHPGDTAQWTFRVDRPGRFKVTAEIAALEPARFTVQVGHQTLSGQSPKTGDYTKSKRVGLTGELDLANPGSFTLAVKPVPDGWQPMNLRSLVLQPVTP